MLGVSLVFLVLGCFLVALVLGSTVPKSVTHRGLLVDLRESSLLGSFELGCFRGLFVY